MTTVMRGGCKPDMTPAECRAPHLDEATHGLAIGGHYVLLVRVHDAIALRPPQVVLQHSPGAQLWSCKAR